MGALSRDAAIADIVFALNAAITKSTVIPTAFARRLAADTAEGNRRAWSNTRVRLAPGHRSKHDGRQSREQRRILGTGDASPSQAVYARMGVHNRTEALLNVSRLGWIR